MEDCGTRKNENDTQDDTQEKRYIREEKEYVNTTLIKELAVALKGKAAITTFTYGGSVPIADLSPNDPPDSKHGPTPPVTLTWDSRTSPELAKITFSLSADGEKSPVALETLLSDSHPATFGFDGQDILNESYRKASKLDTSTFSTNFHPHDYGIVDAVQQVLFPSTVKGGQRVGIGPQLIRAELYKLNVRLRDLSVAISLTGIIRYTLARLAASILMSTRLVESTNSARWWCTYLASMKVCLLLVLCIY